MTTSWPHEVAVGDPLVRLRSDELSARRIELRGEINEWTERAAALRGRIAEATRGGRPIDEAAVARLEGELAETRVRLAGLGERLAQLDERGKGLLVRAPIGGVVATFQLEQRLANRPIARGETLLEVMDPAGDWRLELEVDERRLGHLSRALEEAGDPLDVEYVLATAPERTHHGRLGDLATRVRTSDDGTSVLEVHVDLDRDALPTTRIGTETRARIAAGETSLGYVLFGDVLEFVRSRWWW